MSGTDHWSVSEKRHWLATEIDLFVFGIRFCRQSQIDVSLKLVC